MHFKQWRANLIAIGIPFAIYLILTLPLRGWLIDDAGISFAYARSLAEGFGLVAQPGSEPVEGFSNPLWVLMLAPLFKLGLFEPYLTSKILNALLTAAVFAFVYRTVLSFAEGTRMLSAVCLSCLAVNASFVIWTCSGLENALYAALILLCLLIIFTALNRSEWSPARALSVGVVAVAIALTRPDGIVYAVLMPLSLICLAPSWGGRIRQRLVNPLGIYLLTLVAGYGGYMVLRHVYFGSLLPNTYYAKGGPALSDLPQAITLQEPFRTRFIDLFSSIAGSAMWIIIPVIAVVLLTVYCVKNGHEKKMTLLFSATLLSGLVYILMPNDWMGEFRFATPFFPLFYVTLAIVAKSAIDGSFSSPRRRIVVGASVALVALSTSFYVHFPRLTKFYKSPVVAFETVAERFGHTFNRYASELNIIDGSILLPDIGGTLYYSNLRVHDLTGLCDATIARTLKNNKPAFHDYVFDRLKPTFIHIHGNWTYAARFDIDDRFRRDYVAISEYEDKWVARVTGLHMTSGDYVRRDAVVGREHLLEGLRQ